jgi:hypothetical protein
VGFQKEFGLAQADSAAKKKGLAGFGNPIAVWS